MNLKNSILTLCAFLMLGATSCCQNDSSGSVKYDRYYKNLPFEMQRVAQPNIPSREVNLSDFGGVGDGITLNTEAFARAIAELSSKGGGRLVVPAGVWHTGPIRLESKIDLHVAYGAIVLFSTNKDLYPIEKTYFEGWETFRCQSPISAVGKQDVAITGEGIIDGQGAAWSMVKKDKVTPPYWNNLVKSGGVVSENGKNWYPSESFAMGNADTDFNINRWATTMEDFQKIRDYLRPVMVHIRDCDRVLLEGVVFQNSPCWNIHPVMVRDLTVDGIYVRCPAFAQNGDGIDIESCDRVLMINSSFDVGDDGICIKSGKDEQGRKRGIPTSNVIVDNCTVFHGHGGFVVGSEMSGGVKNISVTNCRFSGTDVGLRFKSTRGRGGVVENIYIDNVSMNNIKTEALLFDLFYGGKSASESLADGDEGEVTDMVGRPVDETTPQFRNIYINNVWCRGARRAMLFNGLPEMNVENVKVTNSAFYANIGAQVNESTNVEFDNVKVVCREGSPLMINNVNGVVIKGFDGATEANTKTLMQVTGSRNKGIEIESKTINEQNSSLSPKSQGTVIFK